MQYSRTEVKKLADYLKKEDYEEPRCPLKGSCGVSSIPTGRVIEKLDEYLNKNDYASAERHLRYWYDEALAGGDMRGMLTVLNEQIGLYRKTEKENECFKAIEEALSLCAETGTENTVTHGTTLVNAATGYKAFGKDNKALPLYRKAREIYENLLDGDDSRLGGLYNNMALAVAEKGNYREAEELYGKAIEVMKKQEHGEAEIAITYLNLADLTAAELGIEAADEKISGYLSKAEELLNTADLPKDGYYAYVCEKCAPVFGYYGYFLFENELNRRARKIYERS